MCRLQDTVFDIGVSACRPLLPHKCTRRPTYLLNFIPVRGYNLLRLFAELSEELSESSRLRLRLRCWTDRVQLETPVPPVFGKERDLTEGLRSPSPGGLFSGLARPKVITISGANKDIGKSSLAAFLAGRCRGCAGMKVSIHPERPPGEVIVEETDPQSAPETDTARLVRAGASPVFWVRTTRENLPRDFREAISHSDAPVIVVEGNSILEHLDPDYAVFIMGPTFEGFKPSAFQAIKKAHTVVVNGGRELSGEEVLQLEREIKEKNPGAKVVVVSELGKQRAWEVVLSRAAGRLGGEYMSAEVDEKVMEAVKAKAKDGRIACAVALKLAEELGVPPFEVGKAANAMKIKIANCSLGCF